jgi:xanthine dehydrogenase accessory factor
VASARERGTGPGARRSTLSALQMDRPLVIIKGGGDLATGVAHRLFQSGFSILITELARPLVVRRTVAFATAVLNGAVDVEGVRAQCSNSVDDAPALFARGEIAVIVDPEAHSILDLRPACVVDAIMAKANLGTRIGDAPVVIALGPGFEAGRDAHAIVETNRGHNLGRVYYQGKAEADTDAPASVQGYTSERVLRAPVSGEFHALGEIGLLVKSGAVLGTVESIPVVAEIDGVVRGLIAAGTYVPAGLKIGDIDPGGDRTRCFTISDKSRAIAGGVLEALLHLRQSIRG